MELLGNISHVIQRGFFLNSNCLSFPWGEVVEEAFPRSRPLCLPVGGLYCVSVVDLEHMLKIPSPPTAVIFGSHLCWTGASGPGMMARLGLGISLGSSRGSVSCHPLAPSGATG